MMFMILDAKKENLEKVFDFLLPLVEAEGASKKTIHECKLCAEEVFLNIAFYAYEQGTGKIKITFDSATEDAVKKLVFKFYDLGTPYDPLSREDPDLDASLEDRPIGGLGVFLIKNTMDEVSYSFRDGQNILQCVKYCREDDEEENE